MEGNYLFTHQIKHNFRVDELHCFGMDQGLLSRVYDCIERKSVEVLLLIFDQSFVVAYRPTFIKIYRFEIINSIFKYFL